MENNNIKNIENLPKLSAEDFQLVQDHMTIQDEKFKTDSIGFFKDAWLRFTRAKISFVAFCILAFLILMSIIGPSLQPYTFNDIFMSKQYLTPKIPGIEKLGILDGTRSIRTDRNKFEDYRKKGLVKEETSTDIVKNRQGKDVEMVSGKIDMYKEKRIADNEYHLFGTDNLGRDLWVRLWRGARVSLALAAVVVFINTTIGIVIGSIMGYFGGWVDLLGYRIIEIISGIPTLILLIIVVSTFGQNIFVIIMAFVLTGWTSTASLIRAQFYKYKGYEYVLASRTMGASDASLIFKHILPNAIGPIITSVSLSVPSVIMSESFLSYLGLGVQPPEPAIGNLLKEGQTALLTNPHMLVWPAAFISILMLCFNLMGNGLRDAFDPTMRGQ